MTLPLLTVDLDETGWLLDADRPVPADRVDEHFARYLTPPTWASDIVVYAHGWKTKPDSALDAARRLHALLAAQHHKHLDLYGKLGDAFAPWTVVVRWPSRGRYRAVRDRAHALSTTPGAHAPRVVAHLLGHLDARRADPAAAPVLANREGQYLHLVGHSFGCRVLCEAVQRAAAHESPTLSWSRPGPADRPFTVDSLLLLQMAAVRGAFATTFTALAEAPLRGPVVATYARRDWATGLWHRIAEGAHGIGAQGIGTAPEPVSQIRLRGAADPYPRRELDHWFVSVDAGEVFTGGHGPAGAHSDHLHPETAHLLLSLAEHAR